MGRNVRRQRRQSRRERTPLRVRSREWRTTCWRRSWPALEGQPEKGQANSRGRERSMPRFRALARDRVRDIAGSVQPQRCSAAAVRIARKSALREGLGGPRQHFALLSPGAGAPPRTARRNGTADRGKRRVLVLLQRRSAPRRGRTRTGRSEARARPTATRRPRRAGVPGGARGASCGSCRRGIRSGLRVRRSRAGRGLPST